MRTVVPACGAFLCLTSPASFSVQNPSHREGKVLPTGTFHLQTPAAATRQLVDASAAVILRRLHLRLDISPHLQAMEGRIERPLAGVQPFARNLANAIRDAPAVIW